MDISYTNSATVGGKIENTAADPNLKAHIASECTQHRTVGMEGFH